MQTLLLGHLAQSATFSKQGELLCTQGLAYLLQDTQAKSHFAAWIGRCAHTEIKGELTWFAETPQPDGGRPDLEGRVGNEPVVKIEAKLGAKLDTSQFRSYAADLQEKRGAATAILLVMVPRYRIAEAEEVVSEAFGLSGRGPWRSIKSISIVVVSWEDLLAVLGESGSQQFRSELKQFTAMHRVLTGEDIEPLADSEELDKWRESKRKNDFENLVDRVTRRLTTHHKTLPMQKEKVSEGRRTTIYCRRYVSRPYGKEEKLSCFFSIGLRDPFLGHRTPIWLRFHKGTGHFSDVRNRLQSSRCKEEKGMLVSGGHIWIPLQVPLKVGTEQIVTDLVKQAEEVVKITYQTDKAA
jgi:hypothetical protein